MMMWRRLLSKRALVEVQEHDDVARPRAGRRRRRLRRVDCRLGGPHLRAVGVNIFYFLDI